MQYIHFLLQSTNQTCSLTFGNRNWSTIGCHQCLRVSTWELPVLMRAKTLGLSLFLEWLAQAPFTTGKEGNE